MTLFLLYFCSASTLAGLAFGYGRPLSPGTAALALVIGGIAAALGAGFRRPRLPLQRPGVWGWASLALFAFFALRSFLWLVFESGDQLLVLSPNNLGDMSLHLCLIRQIANGTPLWPQNPIFSGTQLSYPLGIDLFNALGVIAGADLIRSLIWTGLVGSWLTAMALWRWGGAFCLTGFLCNGGLLGFALLSGSPLADFQAEAAWKSFPLALLVTQRGLLFALPAGLLLLSSWRSRWVAENAPHPGPSSTEPQKIRLPFWGELWLYSTLPLFHPHSFLFLSFLLGCWFLFIPHARRPILLLVGAAFIPATVLMACVTNGFHGPKMLGWQPGWIRENQGFIAFWLSNLGFLPLFVLLLLNRLRDRTALPDRLAVLPALALFLTCCMVRFAPWAWDNTKLMLWCYLLLLPSLHSRLLSSWTPVSRILACILLFFSGGVSLLGGLLTKPDGHPIGNRSTLDGVQSAVKDLPATAVFAGAPTYNHPLLLLGRPMAMGYEGHVWSHGYEWAPRKKQVEQILLGAPGWKQTAESLGVRYLFWGDMEKELYPDSEEPWLQENLRLSSGPWGALYDLQHPRQP